VRLLFGITRFRSFQINPRLKKRYKKVRQGRA